MLISQFDTWTVRGLSGVINILIQRKNLPISETNARLINGEIERLKRILSYGIIADESELLKAFSEIPIKTFDTWLVAGFTGLSNMIQERRGYNKVKIETAYNETAIDVAQELITLLKG